MQSPAWLHGHPAVPLSSWMSTCLSAARPLWACLPACGHLFTSSSISRHGCKNPLPTPSPPDPLPPLPFPPPAGLLHPSLVFPPDTSCEPLMLILQSTSFSPVISPASTALFLKLSLHSAVCTGLLTHKHAIYMLFTPKLGETEWNLE